MTMNDAMTTYPMPAFVCPSWCTVDHVADWQSEAAKIGQQYSIPMADGTVARGFMTSKATAALWTPFHTQDVGEVDLGGNDQAAVDIQLGANDTDAVVYIDAGGPMTPEQARCFAALLLNAADTVEQQVSRG